MAIRPANADDADAVSRLLEIGNSLSLIENDDLRVMTQDSDVVGVLALTDGIDHLLVERLVVPPLPEADTFVKIMVTFAEQEARERGHDQVKLQVSEPLSVYRSLGYRHMGPVEINGARLFSMVKVVV